MTLEELNAAADPVARDVLTACCGTPRWVVAMMKQRPFASRSALLAAADDAWATLTRSDLLVAIIYHPRLGERATPPEGEAPAAAWSAEEQQGAHGADAALQAALAAGNAEYERRFAHRFILNATGRSGGDMLKALRTRLANDPDTELAITSGELRQIMVLRLEKLLGDSPP